MYVRPIVNLRGWWALIAVSQRQERVSAWYTTRAEAVAYADANGWTCLQRE